MRKSIRLQFYAFITALLVTLLLLLNTYPVISARQTVFQEKKSSMSGQASIMASSLMTLDRFSENGVKEVIQLLDIRGYRRIVVTSGEGLVLYDSAGRTGRMTDNQDILSALQGREVFRSGYTGETFDSSYSMPLYDSGLVAGAVYLNEVDAERAGFIDNIQRQLGTLSIVISLLALATALIFTSGLLRRIKALVQSMKVVASGDYAYRHTVKGKDEIAALGREFNTLTEKLQTNEKQRRRFVADASHELKTPLASIRLLADSIVQNDMDTDTMRDFVSDIGVEAERLHRTTEKLLSLSRLDDGVQIIPVPVDIRQVARDAVELLTPLAAESEVTIKHHLADGCVVMANNDDMFHIIFNLIENAIKYNVRGGTVDVDLSADENTISLEVRDTGIGIPEDERLNIFGRFYRVDKARSREAGGSGLGLSIVHDAVIAHGGTIAVGENKPCGSRFVVTFPRPAEGETGI